MEDKEIKFIQEPVFDSASVPIEVAARALNLDKQTVRVMLQQALVPWGVAFKLPKSTQYTYLIYPKKFYEETGFFYCRGEKQEVRE